jgi:hypothetical protein
MPGRPGPVSDDHDNGSWQEAAVPGLIFAAPITPDNTPHGYNWTFAFPMLLFIIIGGVLYLLFSRPHRRVPGRMIAFGARPAQPASSGARVTSAWSGPPPVAAADGGSDAAPTLEVAAVGAPTAEAPEAPSAPEAPPPAPEAPILGSPAADAAGGAEAPA